MSDLLLALQIQEIQDNLTQLRAHKYKIEDILKAVLDARPDSDVQEIQNILDELSVAETKLIKEATNLILFS